MDFKVGGWGQCGRASQGSLTLPVLRVVAEPSQLLNAMAGDKGLRQRYVSDESLGGWVILPAWKTRFDEICGFWFPEGSYSGVLTPLKRRAGGQTPENIKYNGNDELQYILLPIQCRNSPTMRLVSMPKVDISIPSVTCEKQNSPRLNAAVSQSKVETKQLFVGCFGYCCLACQVSFSLLSTSSRSFRPALGASSYVQIAQTVFVPDCPLDSNSASFYLHLHACLLATPCCWPS